jgi:hypothetical protein
MEEVVALMDRLIEEHKAISRGISSLEQLANDASALEALEKARDTFVPGRFDQKENLQQLQKSIDGLSQGLDAHFNREETTLLAAFEQRGSRELVTALNSLLLEHKDLRNRLAHARKHIAELVSGGMGRHQWEASAHDMRTHLSHTRKLLEAHAAVENELFVSMRQYLQSEKDRGD